MKNLIIVASMLAILMSCDKKMEQTTAVETQPGDSMINSGNNAPVESSTVQNCYVGVTRKDSVFVSIDDNLGTFTGKMHYKNSEKDSSLGDIMGTKNGDTLKLNYSFESEGITSDREIYFLMKDGNLMEGIGEHKVENNKDSYANSSKLKYDGQILKKADCKDFEKNFVKK